MKLFYYDNVGVDEGDTLNATLNATLKMAEIETLDDLVELCKKVKDNPEPLGFFKSLEEQLAEGE